MQNPLQRFEMTSGDIDNLMTAFYAKIRKHDTLGSIFIRAIGEGDAEWREHEAKIASFWRNAIMMDRSYMGNPMMAHMQNPEVQAEHFPIWLALFRETAFEVMDAEKAGNIANLADRIGQSLSFGIASARQNADAPPILR